MENSHMDIHKIINLDMFQQLQNDISTSIGLSLVTIDHTGKPITAHSNCQQFCKLMHSSNDLYNLCEKCDARGGLESVRIQNTYIYLCHAGIVDMAIPIVVDGLYLGAFIAGQVRLAKEDHSELLEHLLVDAKTSTLVKNNPDLLELYNQLPIMDLSKIKANAHMLNYFANVCIERSLTHLSSNIELNKEKSATLIQPSLTYIKNHLNEKITLSKMASLCHISPSYYSRLFSKENIGSLSSYVNQQKINRAKEILATTNLPIHVIAKSLGFEDSGYFIKQFKVQTGTTPMKFKSN